jgi:hypothetical protein
MDGAQPHPPHAYRTVGTADAPDRQIVCVESARSARYHCAMSRIYEEIVDFIARGTSPAQIVEFSPSEETKDRVADLIHREKTTELSGEESSELNHYLEIEHILRLAKARARAYQSHE